MRLKFGSLVSSPAVANSEPLDIWRRDPRKILMGDSFNNTLNTQWAIIARVSGTAWRLHLKHSNMANALFLDGSVASIGQDSPHLSTPEAWHTVRVGP